MKELIVNSLKLMSIDSVQSTPENGAPFGEGNRKALSFTLDLAASLGFKTVDYDGYVGFAECGEGEGFDILGHLDTVPIGDGWTHSPLGEVDQWNGEPALYGRGALDDKVPMLACLYAVSELKKEFTPKKRIRLIFGCNEETDWKCIEHFQKVDKIAPSGFSPDADFPVVYYEKGVVHFKLSFPRPEKLESFQSGKRVNVVPDKACAVYDGKRYEATGLSAHGSHPEKGDNAAIKLMGILASATGEKLFFGIHTALSDVFGGGVNLSSFDAEGQYLSLNVGVVNTTDTTLDVFIDFRYPLTLFEGGIKACLQAAFPSAEITKTHAHRLLFVDKESVLVKTLHSAYADISGDKDTQPLSVGGGTYARAMPHGVGFGPIFPDEPMPIHCVDECITIRQLEKMYEIYKEAIKRLCF